MSGPGAPLVIGIGNILLRDEGVGVRVVMALRREAEEGAVTVPPETWFVDGGTLGLELLPMITDASVLILVDAVNLRQPAGSVAVLRGDAIEGMLAGHVSPHQVGIADLIGNTREVALGIVDRLPALKRFFVSEAAGLTGELPRLLKGEAV